LAWKIGRIDSVGAVLDWTECDVNVASTALRALIRLRKTGSSAVDAWRRNYPQIGRLFDEVEGVEVVINVIASNLLGDSKFGLVFRVSLGAGLSMTDAVTDISVITTYYSHNELVTQANALLSMLLLNLFIQLLGVHAQYVGEASEPFEHAQGQPHGIFDAQFAIDRRHVATRRDICVEVKRAVIALVANSLHQQQQVPTGNAHHPPTGNDHHTPLS